MLRKTGSQWEFVSEAALEEFVWANLDSLLGLSPLKQQYHSNGEVCDILALNQAKHLVVIELKNSSDRYIVQQLTRYHDNLLNEQPFSTKVDYEHPIRLIAIMPIFHRHNLIDRKYNQLGFEFWRFQVAYLESKFYLELENLDNQATSQIEIPYREINNVSISEDLPSPPKVLMDSLGVYSIEEQERIFRLRSKILSFDKRMQERVGVKSIKYGRGERNTCAEFYVDRKKHCLVLLMWLVHPSSLNRQMISRMRIWTDWETVSHVAYAKEGIGKAKIQSEWDKIPKEKWPRQYLHNSRSHKSDVALHFTVYRSFINSFMNDRNLSNILESDSLEKLIDMALEWWQAKL